MLGEASTLPGIDRLRLAPLSPPAVAQLALPYGVDPNELHQITGGNPFFVTEVLASGGTTSRRPRKDEPHSTTTPSRPHDQAKE